MLWRGEMCRITISFAPKAPGRQEAVLRVLSNDPEAPVLGIELSGSGVPRRSKIGFFRGGSWDLDFNGNAALDPCGIDQGFLSFGGLPGDVPLAGDWLKKALEDMPVRIAIVHDYLNQMGGAERVVAVFHEMFPEAPIFTTLVDRSLLTPELAAADIRPSWMQRLPGWRKHFKKYLLFYPKAIESLDLRGYDVVISSSSAFAKGAVKQEGALHVCYCYTPMRFVWDYENYLERERLPVAYQKMLPFAIRRLRKWDLATRCRPDRYLAISSCVKERIGRIYGQEAKVIYPPVEVQRFERSARGGDYYLVVSRLAAYKRLDLAVRAFNILGLPLKVIGSGPAGQSLKNQAGPNIEFRGRVSDGELAAYYAGCKALIFPGVEDFGLAPLEANAAGRPAIAFHGGGALDTIDPEVNGLFFREPSAESLVAAVRLLESAGVNFQSARIREHAWKFDKSVFKEQFRQYLTGLLGGKGARDPDPAQVAL